MHRVDPDRALRQTAGAHAAEANAPGTPDAGHGLEVVGLSKSFDRLPVLHGVDLTVPAGSIAALLGASGSGKTTFLRLLAGFEPPDAGRIVIGGRLVEGDGQRVAPERRGVGYVPQEGALFPHLDVAANVGFGLPRRRRWQVGPLLDLVGLSEHARRFPHQLSGGQQQRVALARALAVEPRIVLLDEPFSSLDPNLRASVREEVAAILRRSGTTVLLVTHDQDEALSLADVVAVLRGGVVAQCATPRQLYADPVDPELARFLGEANLLPGTLQDGTVATALGRFPARLPGRACGDPETAGTGSIAATGTGAPMAVEVLVRPEQIELVSLGAGAPPGIDAPRGEVERLTYYGHDAVVTVRPEGGADDRSLVVRTPGDPGVRPGERVLLRAFGSVLVWPLPGRSPAG